MAKIEFPIFPINLDLFPTLRNFLYFIQLCLESKHNCHVNKRIIYPYFRIYKIIVRHMVQKLHIFKTILY